MEGNRGGRSVQGNPEKTFQSLRFDMLLDLFDIFGLLSLFPLLRIYGNNERFMVK